MNAGMRIAGAGVGLLALAGIVAGSHGRLTGVRGDDAIVRVAWSARPERVETCRRLTEDELAKQPAHMRTRVACEGTTARYRLEISRDDVMLDTATVRGGGLRHDREVYVSREIPVPPGSGRIAVRFIRIDSSTTPIEEPGTEAADRAKGAERPGGPDRKGDQAGRDSAPTPALADRSVREEDERRRRRAQAIPPQLVIDTTVTLGPRTVLLITYDEALRRLVATEKPR